MSALDQKIIIIINQHLQQLNTAGLKHVLSFVRGLTEKGKGA